MSAPVKLHEVTSALTNTTTNNNKFTFKCTRCGYNHKTAQDCPANGKTCANCSKPHHFANVCRNKSINKLNNGEKINKRQSLKTFNVKKESNDFSIGSIKKTDNNIRA